MTIPSFYELQQRRAISHLGLDPFPWYKQMRMTDPVSVNEQDQLCELFRYTDIQAVLADPLLFSSKSLLGEDEEWAKRGSILASDPPYHNKLRALVSQAFTPRAIAKNADKIRSIVNELLDAGTTSGTLEIIQDLAAPLPLRVIAEMMGVPFEHQDNLKRWVRQGLVEGISPEQASVNLLAFEDYMRTLL